jgi:pimeloyl-ACP methyl ester carboxylesterase
MPLATTRQGSLHYEIVDQVAPARVPREAILFHHGIGASAGLWAAWFPALADAHRLVSFDMRGYGRSHIPAADFAWSLEQMVDDLFAVADGAGLQRFHLVGETIGGTVALAAALARPQRIATLTVSNGAHLGASIQRADA